MSSAISYVGLARTMGGWLWKLAAVALTAKPMRWITLPVAEGAVAVPCPAVVDR